MLGELNRFGWLLPKDAGAENQAGVKRTNKYSGAILTTKRKEVTHISEVLNHVKF